MYTKDSDLIKACLDGNESAWKELVDRYARLVYSIPYRWGFSPADADDIFQNVFAIVYRQLASLRDQRLLVAWLIRITRNECQHFQRRTSSREEEPPESLVDTTTLPEDEVEIMERQHLVRTALNLLEPRCRDLLMALFLASDPSSYTEISTRLNIPVGSIGPVRARCFKKLETALVTVGFDPNTYVGSADSGINDR